jgi:lysophospholipase L1-like esterase
MSRPNTPGGAFFGVSITTTGTLADYIEDVGSELFANKAATAAALAELDAIASTGSPAAAKIIRPVVIANRTQEMTAKQGAGVNNYTRDEGRLKVQMPRSAVQSVQLLFGNYYVTDQEMTDTSPITVTASVELPTSPVTLPYAVTFNGKKSIVLDPGEYILSDPVPIQVAADGFFWVRSGITVSAGGNTWPCTYSTRLTGENFRQSLDVSSQVYNTGALSAVGGGSVGFGPIAVIGTPEDTATGRTLVSVIGVGDSIMRGSGDSSPDAYGNTGMARGCADVSGHHVPFLTMARDSDRAQYNQVTAYRKRAPWRYGTHLLCNLGTNDLAGGRTLAELQADITAIWTDAKRVGLKVYQCNLLPRVTGTFSTAAGQTPIAGFESGGLRDQFNAWLLTQVGTYLEGVIDVASAVEDPSNHGKWAANLTADGIHPVSSAYVLIGNALRPAVAGFVA